MDHSSLPSSDSNCCPSNLRPDFDRHLSLGKFEQELAVPWHSAPSNLLNAAKIPDNSFGFGCARLSPAFAMETTPQSLRDAPELAGDSMPSESWDAGACRKLSYASPLGSLLPASRNVLESSINSQGQIRSESSTGVTELVGRMDMNGNGSETMSSILAASTPLSEVERLMSLSSSNWGSVNVTSNMGLTVDPLKGGLAIQGTKLAASCCLPDFSTDPGFAERAAKFSCFSSQTYPEVAQRFSVSESGKTAINRSASRAIDKITPTKTAKISSGHLTPRCSAPNSPGGTTVSGSAQGQSSPAENSLRGKQESALNADDQKFADNRSGRTSCSPSRNDGSDGSLGQEESSSCERGACDGALQGAIENPGKKRRIGSKSRSKDLARPANLAEGKDLDTDDGKGKRSNFDDETKQLMLNVEQTNSGNSGDSTPKSVKENPKPLEAGPKSDYIHVRARRGQATDSHSLAERVRREKISERMKFLQDLVPGCSKVTGKAVMLDEIINYVQSLQRQVEFLSMKLAAVNPRMDLNLENLFGREIFQPRVAPNSTLLFAPENSTSYPQLQQAQCTMQGPVSCPPVDAHSIGSESALRRTASNPAVSTNGFGSSVSQVPQAWDDDLQSVVQMGFAQGRLIPGQMKIEL